MACIRFSNGQRGAVGCTLGIAPHVFVGAYGTDAVDALHRASDLAKEMDGIIKAHPELAVVAPQFAVAMKAVSAASDLIKKGGSVDDVAKNIGPAAASLMSSVLKAFI